MEVEEGALGAAVGLVEEEGAPEAPLQEEDLGVASEGHPVAVAFVVEADDRPPTLAMVSNSFNTAAATARHVGFMLVLLPYGSTSAAELT